MNDRERAICARLKLFREQIKWPLEAFAQEIGISHHKLAGIEYARTPLKYKVAIVICEVFDLNAEWIVTGRGERHGVQPFLWVVESGPNTYGNQLLSDVYDSSPELFQSVKHEDIFKPMIESVALGCDPQNYIEKLVPIWFSGAKFRSPLDAQRFAKKIEEIVGRMLELYLRAGTSSRVRISAGRGNKGVARQAMLDTSAAAIDSPDMQALKSVPELVARLKRLSKKFGSKAALARKLKVSRQAVDQWLNGKTTPSTDIAIKVMNLE